MIKFFGIVLACMLSGCVMKGSPTPLPDINTENAKVFQSRCSDVCHSAPHPKRHTFSQWQKMVAIMKVNMQEKGLEPLDAKEEEAILTYLKEHSR